MKLNLVLPAAGRGSRFREVGIETPKPLIKVGDFPMILWALSNFPLLQNDTVWIICQKKDLLYENLKEYIQNLNFEINFIYLEYLTEGPANTLLYCLDKLMLSIPLISANSDQFVLTSLDPYIDEVRSQQDIGQILTMEAEGDAWSYVGRDDAGNIVRVVEKKQISTEATVGIYGWSETKYALSSITRMIEMNDRVNNEFYVAPSYNYLLKDGYTLKTFNLGNHAEYVHGLGTPKDLFNFKSRSDFNYYNQIVASYLNI